MKISAVFILLILFSLAAFGQTPNPSVKNSRKLVPTKNLADEKAEFDKAVALADAAERIAALRKFVEDFPKSKEKVRALELVASGRAALADEKLRSGEKETGIELFKLAVGEAPKPVSDKLFTDVLLQIPTSLFFRGERNAAETIALLIESKADGNAKQMLALATYYLGTENAAEAKRLADKAIRLEPNLPAAYQTLGIANRLDFQLEESVNAYAKALELDANSNVSKRSLAEMKRATGKASEAVTLYREVLTKDAADGAANTGLILALFDAENKTEAEAELIKSLEANPNNLFLLVGAAYWYAAHNDGAKAIELAEKAVAVEPRYTWARIALARGLMQQKRPLEAEKSLLAARQYGDFPTLEYELATARFQAGFYREAVEGLQKKFAVKDNLITAKLGGRVTKDAKSFIELLAAERRASIFQVLAADNIETADKLKSLLDFSQKIETAGDESIVAAADEFVKGDDRMKLHRQLFAANRLLENRKALPKVLELTKAAVGNVDAALDVPNPSPAVLADELYQSRRIAATRNELIIVPDVPRQTLSNILRGRIEDITGWTLFQENKSGEAITRLKRAVSVLPEKSSWWRNAMWRLGTAQDAAGNPKDALDAYLKSYTSGDADVIKYGIIEAAYQKVNGSTDGLEIKIGAKPTPIYAAQTEAKTVEQPKTESTPEVKAEEIKPETAPIRTVTETPQPIAETKLIPEVPNTEIIPKTEPAPKSETKVENPPILETKTEISPIVEIKTEIAPDEKKTETKQSEPIKNPNSETTAKSIFEPIIITVPKTESLKKPQAETKQPDQPTENETPKAETKTDEIKQEKKSSDENIETRPRVFVEENLALPCKITVSQEIVSVIGNGGNLSLLVGVEGDADVPEIKATSSSPKDVEIVLEPEMGNQSNRAFFVVKSISPKTGAFTITFESACGKKEVLVKVR